MAFKDILQLSEMNMNIIYLYVYKENYKEDGDNLICFTSRCECGQGRKLCSESSDDINKTEYLLNMLRIFALDQGGEGSEKQVTILRRSSGVYL